MSKKEPDIPEPVRIELDDINTLWPVYRRNEVAVGDLESSIAIVSLWTERQNLLNHLNPDDYSVIGQCYSLEGFNLIVRDLIANPRIKTLVNFGRDLTGTGEMIRVFFEEGVNKDCTLPGLGSIMVDEDIPMEEIERLRNNITYVDLRKKLKGNDYESLAKVVRGLSDVKEPWRNFGMRYPLVMVEPERMPGELVGYQAKGETVEEVWLDILNNILRFGRKKEIPGEDFKVDIPNLTAIINGDENYTKMIHPEIFKHIPNFEKGVEHYVKQFTESRHIAEIAYHYGEEMFSHDTRNGLVNQIDYIVKKLSSNIHSGRAFASTWNVGRHMEAPEGPCLVDVQFSAINETENKYQLLLTAHFKTHDMFSAWPSNVFGLRELQRLVLSQLEQPFQDKNLELKLGPLETFSGSAHIYQGQVKNAQETIDEFPLDSYRAYNLPGKLIQDPRGNYGITLIEEGGKHGISIEHYDTQLGGKIIESEKFYRSSDAKRWLASNGRFSDPNHGLSLGEEIAKAFTVIDLKERGIEIDYQQDRVLDFSKIKS